MRRPQKTSRERIEARIVQKMDDVFLLTEAERAYNEGCSTQAPINAVVRVGGRFSRRLGYRGHALVLER